MLKILLSARHGIKSSHYLEMKDVFTLLILRENLNLLFEEQPEAVLRQRPGKNISPDIL